MKKDRPRDSDDYRAAKFALADRIRREKRLSFAARVLGAEIVSRAWESSGCTDAQAWFMQVLDMSERAVRDGTEALEKLGYIEVKKRGRANVYLLMFEQRQNMPISEGGDADTKPAKCDSKTGKKQQKIPAKNTTLIPLETLPLDPLSGEADADADARARANKFDPRSSEAVRIVKRLAEIAGFDRNQILPLYWQSANQVILRWMDRGFTLDAILTGATLTMRNKPTPGPPISIEYFEGEISKVMKIRSLEMPRAEYQSYLREIAAKLGPGADGWITLQGLSEAEADELVWRWSRGEVADDELHRLKTTIDAKSPELVQRRAEVRRCADGR